MRQLVFCLSEMNQNTWQEYCIHFLLPNLNMLYLIFDRKENIFIPKKNSLKYHSERNKIMLPFIVCVADRHDELLLALRPIIVNVIYFQIAYCLSKFNNSIYMIFIFCVKTLDIKHNIQFNFRK